MMETSETIQGKFGSKGSDRQDAISEATARVRENVEQFVEGFDLQAISKRIEDFGRENPMGLAISALTLGLAIGVLVRKPRQLSQL